MHDAHVARSAADLRRSEALDHDFEDVPIPDIPSSAANTFFPLSSLHPEQNDQNRAVSEKGQGLDRLNSFKKRANHRRSIRDSDYVKYMQDGKCAADDKNVIAEITD